MARAHLSGPQSQGSLAQGAGLGEGRNAKAKCGTLLSQEKKMRREKSSVALLHERTELSARKVMYWREMRR